MIIRYRCPSCRQLLGEFSVASLDEMRFGLDILTPSEKGDIIDVIDANLIEIKTRCDTCLPVEEINMLQHRFSENILH